MKCKCGNQINADYPESHYLCDSCQSDVEYEAYLDLLREKEMIKFYGH